MCMSKYFYFRSGLHTGQGTCTCSSTSMYSDSSTACAVSGDRRGPLPTLVRAILQYDTVLGCLPWSARLSCTCAKSSLSPMKYGHYGLDQSMRGRLFSPRLNKLVTTNGCVNTVLDTTILVQVKSVYPPSLHKFVSAA